MTWTWEQWFVVGLVIAIYGVVAALISWDLRRRKPK